METTGRRLATIFALLYTSLATAPAAERVALVIGVNRYEHLAANAQLSVAVSDAELMTETLRSLEQPFQVTLLADVSQGDAEEAYETFLERAGDAECALVYFAGHGIEYNGSNYLLVKDTAISDISADVELRKRRLVREALSLQAMVDSLDLTGAAVKLVVLDCCRNIPSRRTRRQGVAPSSGAAAASLRSPPRAAHPSATPPTRDSEPTMDFSPRSLRKI